MKKNYSIFSLIKNSFSNNENWQKMWQSPEPKKTYDVIIVGGGGHGLGTAYYLAKQHGIKNIAVIEKGWLGGGNTGRNTTIIRSNYLWNESAYLYDHSIKLWENLSKELNYNMMFSQRGVMNLAHNEHDIKEMKRRISANRLNGLDTKWLDTKEITESINVEKSTELLKDNEICKENKIQENTTVENNIKISKISDFFSYLLVFLISFVALIILLDTLKSPLINVFPGLEIILFNLFETLKDVKLFIIDLT